MVYYHVRITERGQQHDEVKNDIDQDKLEAQFLSPYRAGRPITINGRAIPSDKLDRIRISVSEFPSAQIIPQLKYEDRNSQVVVIGGPSYEWLAADRAADVTDQFILGPPGSEIPSVPPATNFNAVQNVIAGPGDKRSVFIVSGRDSEATAAIVQVLRAMNLRIVEWAHAVLATGVPNPYTGDVVAIGMSMADAAVVIITPDDLVQLRADLLNDDDAEVERNICGQPRPNVIYEAGYADALGRNRTLIIEIGSSKSFSDVAGRNTLRYDGTPAKRNALAQRLRLAGLIPDTGGDDWLSVGEVTSAITKATAAVDAARTKA